ncbi:hypothetical protein FISHEDRAFT_60963 [Fistulina hepatica ATCC 64428]|uniref:Uncharacterized protein n=1 Tax=Fistulina hepatica ATCC 64428 TaxID=1128425 RepID=A0A0D7A3E1_9AGAR|nr:hypothetical protein FISHEDRAFT_60963 [Fistulina hepatica ATCC 64428]
MYMYNDMSPRDWIFQSVEGIEWRDAFRSSDGSVQDLQVGLYNLGKSLDNMYSVFTYVYRACVPKYILYATSCRGYSLIFVYATRRAQQPVHQPQYQQEYPPRTRVQYLSRHDADPRIERSAQMHGATTGPSSAHSNSQYDYGANEYHKSMDSTDTVVVPSQPSAKVVGPVVRTLTMPQKNFLNTTAEDVELGTVYTISTTKKYLRRHTTAVNTPGSPASFGAIYWRDQAFEIGGLRVPWDQVKMTRQGMFPKKDRTWSWNGRTYVVSFDQNVGWTMLEQQSSGIVADYKACKNPWCGEVTPGTYRVCTGDLYSREAAFFMLVMLYSEMRRQRSARRKHLIIGLIIKIIIIHLIILLVRHIRHEKGL